MTAPTIINAATAATVPEADLASLVAARLCHDLVSPLGAIGNGVELLEMSGDQSGLARSPELSLITESVRAARARLRFFRSAFGHAPADARVALPEIAQLLGDVTEGTRLTVELNGQGDLSRPEARMLLLSFLCLDSAMPWGGRVLICRTAPGWRVVGEATRMRIDRDLWRWLDGDAAPMQPMPPAAAVHFPLLGRMAAQLARPVTWEVDETGAEISF
ncbi:histidine phosphotransferase family protein [Paracoccus sanguinis]|uniref:histidine phosphotransferase family protein n=1 Tax=Paracoccus sanguinis TaxID=1545044 RepID=UPI0014512241|nr:histidine phosphotransferase family protein [Paracoccus sanguinis]QJD17890.1 histidine phosphotransferase [Paracoccus sanguinis]